MQKDKIKKLEKGLIRLNKELQIAEEKFKRLEDKLIKQQGVLIKFSKSLSDLQNDLQFKKSWQSLSDFIQTFSTSDSQLEQINKQLKNISLRKPVKSSLAGHKENKLILMPSQAKNGLLAFLRKAEQLQQNIVIRTQAYRPTAFERVSRFFGFFFSTTRKKAYQAKLSELNNLNQCSALLQEKIKALKETEYIVYLREKNSLNVNSIEIERVQQKIESLKQAIQLNKAAISKTDISYKAEHMSAIPTEKNKIPKRLNPL